MLHIKEVGSTQHFMNLMFVIIHCTSLQHRILSSTINKIKYWAKIRTKSIGTYRMWVISSWIDWSWLVSL